MSSVLDSIVALVSLPPHERSRTEADKFTSWFQKRGDVFKSLKPDAVSEIIKNCDLIERPRDSVVIKQLDRGDCFFVILSGKVSVYITAIKDEEYESKDETDSHPPPESKDSMSRLQRVMVNSELFPRLQSLPIPRKKLPTLQDVVEAFQMPRGRNTISAPLDRSKFGQWLAYLEDGKSFGELALIRKDCIRNATIITEETTQLLVVNRELYNKCIKDSQEKEFDAKYSFVESSEYFERWSLRNKHLLAMSLTISVFSYSEPIVCQGHPANNIYFLKSGQCRVVINPTLHHMQYPEYKSLVYKDKHINRSTQAGKLLKRRSKSALKEHDVCLIGDKNMIGDIELTTGMSTYLQTVVCEQETQAYVLDIRNYYRLVAKRHPTTVRQILSDGLLKLSNRAARFHEIPLLQLILQKHQPVQRTSPVPPAGPMVDIFGEGTVYQYIRRRDKQLKRMKSWYSLEKSQSLVNAHPDTPTKPTAEEPNPDRKDSADSASSSTSGVKILRVFEQQHKSRVEARIMDWCVRLDHMNRTPQRPHSLF